MVVFSPGGQHLRRRWRRAAAGLKAAYHSATTTMIPGLGDPVG